MPDKKTVARAKKDKEEGKAPSTQAGEFVREEMDHIREGKHGARSAKQAIAIGLSKARQAGVEISPGPKGKGKAAAKKKGAPSKERSAASEKALKREGSAAASHEALSKQAKSAARKRGPAKRSQAAEKAARTRKREA